MNYYVKAWDSIHGNAKQILGNVDGQGIIKAMNYRKTAHYKRLINEDRSKLSLNGRACFYTIEDCFGNILEEIQK